MKSDNWNFLSNLLGTPAPTPPPEEPKEQEKSKSLSSQQSDQPASNPTSHKKPLVDPATAATDSPTAGKSLVGSVLEALKAAIPPTTLPGFGAVADQDTDDAPGFRPPYSPRSEPDAGPSRRETSSSKPYQPASQIGSAPIENSGMGGGIAKDMDAAWGELASELGVPVADADPVPRVEQPARSDHQAPTPSRPQSDRPQTNRPASSSGFGSGLGLDLEPEPDSDSDLGLEFKPKSSLFERPSAGEPARRSGTDDRPAARRPEQTDRDRQNRGPSGERAPADSWERDPIEKAPGARRRGRRGQRQQIADDDVDALDRPRSDVPESDRDDFEEVRSWEPARGDSPGNENLTSGRGGRGRGRSREDAEPRHRDDSQGRDHSRHRESDDREQPKRRDQADTFAANLDLELDAESVASRESSGESSDDSPRGRSRRRGRRGRGRGREAVDSPPRDSETSGQSDNPTEVKESYFDDDHEDDLEVEAIRRGRGRRPSNLDENREIDRDRPADRGSRRDRDTTARGRSDRDRSDVDSMASRQSRNNDDVPTWLETVDLLISVNIENHKKARSGGSGNGNGGGAGRGRGRGRRG